MSFQVRETWYTSIWKHKWGDPTLAAIYLRKYRGIVEPSDREVVLCARRDIGMVRAKVTAQDVRDAFEQGQEVSYM